MKSDLASILADKRCIVQFLPANTGNKWLLCASICNKEMLKFLWLLTVNGRYIAEAQNVVVFVKRESSLYKLCVCVKYLLATATIVVCLKTCPSII